MFVEATVRAFHQLRRRVFSSLPCFPHPSRSSSASNLRPQADLDPPHMDLEMDVLGHVDYLYSSDSADRELYKVSLMLRGAISLLFVVDLDIRYLD
jgi:hypothetical protein